MNFKSILVVGLGFATLGLSLPAHADTATVISNTQQAIVTGDRNFTNQSNNTSVRSSQFGRSNGSTGTSVSSGQFADVQGKSNYTNQTNSTSVNNFSQRRSH
jgi:hypothetical protein